MMAALRTEDRARPARVWDAVVRLTHWAIALLVLVNLGLPEEGARAHQLVGYGVLALVGLRLAWGVVGSREARFSAFPPSLGAARAHLRALMAGTAPVHRSHNPLGALMVYALWAVLIALAATGMVAVLADLPTPMTEAMEEGHEALSSLLIGLVVLHVAGVLAESLRSGVNLMRAMITGDKDLPADA